MTESLPGRPGTFASRAPTPYGQTSTSSLADILERVLDKGIVIAGDIRINLLDIELLTIKLRILIASVDKAKEMGIDWWEHGPSLSEAGTPAAPGTGEPPPARGTRSPPRPDRPGPARRGRRGPR